MKEDKGVAFPCLNLGNKNNFPVCPFLIEFKSIIENWLLVLFVIHFTVRVWTLAYFAPNIIEFQKIANGGGDAVGLSSRTLRWRQLNYLRVGLFIAVSIALIPLCIKLSAYLTQ